MPDLEDKIKRYYTMGGIMSSILDNLESAGKQISELKPADLAPIDQFHIRGKVSTLELAALVQFSAGLRVLDVGCGLGGSARYIAEEHNCNVTGVDLTAEYIEAAQQLSDMVGLKSKVRFKQASALNLPFDNESFDVVWTEHAQMNIEDKEQFYKEISRVLVPGGRLAFHDVFQGDSDSPHFPVPWAEESSLSALIAPDAARAAIERSQLVIRDWLDKSDDSLQWFKETAAKAKAAGRRPLSIHLLLGATTGQKLKNIIRNLQEKRITLIQGVALKP
jgi:ubiquinone/menaquinone biosynthesis C-methylase UbiE